MNIKQEMVKRLKIDCKRLIENKLPKALDCAVDDRGVGTYRNLTKALADNIKLIEEYDWKLMHSEYTTTGEDGNPKKQVTVWEQNSDGEIRNHKVWNVENTINTKYTDFQELMLSIIECFSVDDKIIIPTSEAIRGVGKTTFLIQQAIKNDGVYVCMSKQSAKLASEKARNMFGGGLQTMCFDMDFRVTDSKICIAKPLYIDEGVDLSRLDLDKNRYVAFKYIHLNQKIDNQYLVAKDF